MNDNLEHVHDGISCWYSHRMNINESFLKIRRESKKSIICPLCKEELKSGDEIYLAMNNFKLFPNIFIHTKCVEKIGASLATDILIGSYENAKKYKEIIDVWF